jgi:hypothetical protein
MSLLIMPAISTPFFLASSAKCVEPNRPCSSPATAKKMSVASKRWNAIMQASSMATATPEASSFAPGAALSASITSPARES